MVGAVDLAVDRRGLNRILQPVGDEKIIDAPACVLFPRVKPVAPPGVCARKLGVPETEGVRKSGGKQLCEAFALFIGKAGVPAVWAGVLEVDFLMGNV